MKKWIWPVLAVPLVLAGCNLFNRDFSREDPNTGSLVLLLDGSTIATKTIAPPNMTPARYDILMTHTSSGATVSAEDWTSGVFTRNGLATGGWTVSITAEDSTGKEIGAILGSVSGTDNFTILPGEVISKTVSIVPILGTGFLSLSLTWPEGYVNSPAVAAWLVPESAVDPYTNHPITFDVDPDLRTAIYEVLLPPGMTTGYYTLLIQLSDTSPAKLVWGWAESVRIVSETTTTGTLQLNSDNAGGLTLNITVDMEDPIAINWNPATPPSSITLGQNLTVTAVPAQTAMTGYEFLYQWYLDGAALPGKTSETITHGAALTAGEYSLCVVVTERQISAPNAVRTISSNGFGFSVTP